VGMVHYSDNHKLANLKEVVAPYLTKPDYYFRLVVPKGRTFGTSVSRRCSVRLGRKRG
jgi:hypothetical protein